MGVLRGKIYNSSEHKDGEEVTIVGITGTSEYDTYYLICQYNGPMLKRYILPYNEEIVKR